MDFTTFKKAAGLLPKNVSIVMRGRHGIGKSEQIRQLAEESGLPLIDRRLSQLTEGDLLGLPKIDGESTKFLPPEWFVKAMNEPHFIFLDEYDRAINEVQQAGMEFILERSIQGKKIHEGCRIFAAINGGKYGAMYNVNSIDPAINDRFWIADVEPTVEEWIKWARENGIINEIIDFISIHPNSLERDVQKEPHEITPSRRSWARLSKTLNNNPDIIANTIQNGEKTLFRAVCTGFIGMSDTGLFLDFITNPQNHIFAKDIINSYPEYKERISKFRIEQLNLIIKKVSDYSNDRKNKPWSKDQVKNVADYFTSLPSELKMSMWDKISSTGANIKNVHKLNDIVKPQIMDILDL